MESQLTEATFRRDSGRPTYRVGAGWSEPRHRASNFEKRIVSCTHRSESTGVDTSPHPRGEDQPTERLAPLGPPRGEVDLAPSALSPCEPRGGGESSRQPRRVTPPGRGAKPGRSTSSPTARAGGRAAATAREPNRIFGTRVSERVSARSTRWQAAGPRGRAPSGARRGDGPRCEEASRGDSGAQDDAG